jgi:hypothetical protein
VKAAAEAVDRLLDLFPPLDVGNPRAFIAGLVAIFANYPAEVWKYVVDPVHGLPGRTARPTLYDLKTVCDEFYEPLARQIARERALQYRELEVANEAKLLEDSRRRADLRRALEQKDIAAARARLAANGMVVTDARKDH